MKRAELLWFAGLLEGEGCFNIRKARNQPRVTIEMTDRDIIDRVADLWGSNVSVRSPRQLAKCPCGSATCRINPRLSQTSYQTAIYGDRARNMMRLAYVVMGTRRSAKISEILGGLI